MDLSKIHYFFKAAQLLNFTQAANECHIAQTTMSKYIATLEQELHTSLFIREQKKLTLTKQGQQFYEGMTKIYSDYESLCSSLSNQETQELRIGMKTTDYSDFSIFESFEKKYPHIHISYVFEDEQLLLKELKQKRLDALICPDILHFYHEMNDSIHTIDLASIPVGVVCSKELLHRYTTIENVIQYTPFITKTSEVQYHQLCKQQLYHQFHQQLQDIKIVKEYPEQLLWLNLSRGYSILPIMAVQSQMNLICFPLDKEFNEIEKFIYLKDKPAPCLSLLLEYMHEKKC